MSQELKPCPFCGREAKLDVEEGRDDNAWCFIRCSYRCKAAPHVGDHTVIWYWSEGKKYRHQSDEKAIEQARERATAAWNNRADDRLQAENAALQQRLNVADEQVDILSGGLRLMTSFGSGTNIAGVKTVAKQTLNRAAGVIQRSGPAASQTNTSGKAHCPHCGICHTSDETCHEAKARIASLGSGAKVCQQPQAHPARCGCEQNQQ